MTKYLKVTMPDGSQYLVPAATIARNRAEYYAKSDSEKGDGDYDTIFKEEFAFAMLGADNYCEIKDWASNNMNWVDVKDGAIKVVREEMSERQFQEGWLNGKKKIVEE